MSNANEPEYPSLTHSVVQIRWKVPTEFPACPQAVSDRGLEEYAAGLTFGGVFSRNNYATSLVVHHHVSDGTLVVLTRFAGKSIKDWAVAHVSIQADRFLHRSEYTFHTLQGALKHFCELAGEDYLESIDDLVG